IYKTIRSKYPNACGIIYCASQRACEDMAQKLRDNGFRAAHYHAGLDKDDRITVQMDWIHGRVNIIVATVAFGMGIDKPDVRFVMHFSFPQSLEGYYQETGRAGRDGRPSLCIMYYTFADKRIHDILIQRGEGSADQKERVRNNLRLMIGYCENKVECRREQVLAYFGEKFNREDCHGTCDNC
ncbi:P-loop containing nucleoside triphosphate hydrolase protein, partial [Caulochytrium protostelioides]